MRLSSKSAVAIILVFSSCTAAEPNSFDPLLHFCPQLCDIVGPVPSNWTLSHDLTQLSQCNQTVLLDFALVNPIEDPKTHTTIRACTVTDSTVNIKRQAGSQDCGPTQKAPATIQVGSLGAVSNSNNPSVIAAVSSLETKITQEATCNSPRILFAYSGGTVVGIYAGSKVVVPENIAKFAESLSNAAKDKGIGDTYISQSCGDWRDGDHTIGLVANTKSNFGIVQNAMRRWTNATCVQDLDNIVTSNVTLLELPPRKPSTISKRSRKLNARATCSYIQVVSGDSCWSLSQACKITQAQFITYNPTPDLCPNLQIGQYVCCSAGTLPDFTPKPNADGTCAKYTVQEDDWCEKIATAKFITLAKLEAYNTKTWGWQGCDNIQLGQEICVSSGDPPMPAIVWDATCGPQVPGTQRPAVWSTIASLNPCQLNTCCNIWGNCGTTPEFCTVSQSTTGAPGTSAPGEAGCISNCGTAIANNAVKPAEFKSVGYFEAWNMDRAGLHMNATQIPRAYTHIHFAFGDITSDYQVDVSQVSDQFNKFKSSTSYKRILSFGGWSFSTDYDTAPIFRDGVTPAQRQTFATNVVNFMNQHGLDGLDFDWEYPGAPDIPGIPPGGPNDGANYLTFLKLVRSLMPAGKSLSIAAPASHWYLKGFPIKDMAPVLDYIVYMIYDLHGQWDYGSPFSNPGCDFGNCLRSHVNITETLFALSMVTKAGVPASKIVVGISAYGRSFGMTDPNCSGPACTFTGPDSTAKQGPYTDDAGYISNAEIEQWIQQGGTYWHDSSSDSDMVVYQRTWVAYMNQATIASRSIQYENLNFGGTVSWAVDLEAVSGNSNPPIDVAESTKLFKSALAKASIHLTEMQRPSLSG